MDRRGRLALPPEASASYLADILLREVRAKGADGIVRAIHIIVSGRRVVVPHAFVKKSQKTPAGALAIARRREKEVGE